MEGRGFIIIILFVGVIAGLISAIQHSQVIDRINLDVMEEKKKLAEMQAGVERLKSEWAKVEAVSQKLKTAQFKLPPIEAQKEELLKKYRGLEGEFKYLVRSTRDLVVKIRENGPGEAFAELRLADGRVLKDVKLRKIEGEQFSFSHSEGFASIKIDLLPFELLEKYDVGPRSLVPELEITERQLFSPGAATSATSSKGGR